MTGRSPDRQKPFYSLNNNVKQRSGDSTSSTTTGLASVQVVVVGGREECTLRERFRPGRATQPRRMPLRKVRAASASADTDANRNGLSRQDTLDQILTSCNARAMRYYRIWIYTCNAVLFLSVLAFCAVAGRVLVGDYRRYLIPNLALYQPSFLYAYLALFTQSGVLQVIGCIGALRLSERLLNVYWLMLLILLFGDVVIGIFWMFRFDKICQELKPNLKFRLHTEYGYNSEMTILWDRLQMDFECCGVQNALDYGHLNRTGAQMLAWIPEPTPGSISESVVPGSVYVVPVSCCSSITSERTLDSNVTESSSKEHVHRSLCQVVHSAGCEERLQVYLRQSADILFILGYCVIAFLKLCFLGILRYEIREMIQKIKILQAEMETRPSVISLDNNSSQNLGLSSPSHTILINTASANGSVPGGACCDSTRTSTLHKPSYESTESERESLLVKEPPDQPPTPPLHPHPAAATRAFLSAENLEYHQRNLQETCRAKLFPGDAAADSDTNSHCALLVDETSSPTSQNLLKNPNGNNNYELHEFREHMLIGSSAGGAVVEHLTKVSPGEPLQPGPLQSGEEGPPGDAARGTVYSKTAPPEQGSVSGLGLLTNSLRFSGLQTVDVSM
ncbi:Tetraspanin 5D [Carabus blaptoides fortunei]